MMLCKINEKLISEQVYYTERELLESQGSWFLGLPTTPTVDTVSRSSSVSSSWGGIGGGGRNEVDGFVGRVGSGFGNGSLLSMASLRLSRMMRHV